MNKLLIAALIASTALAAVATKKTTDAEYDRAQIKEDVRLLMNDIDVFSAIVNYVGGIYVGRHWDED